MDKKDLRRDPKSGAILNTNRDAYDEYKAKTLKDKQTETRITSLETKMDKILKLMEKIANG